MKFYFKFTKLPFVYTVVDAVNSAKAKNKIEEHRLDSVLFKKDDLCISFDDYHNNRFEYKPIEDIEEKVDVSVIDAISNSEVRHGTVSKPNILNACVDLVYPIAKDIPGFSKGKVQLISRSKNEVALCVKATEKYIKYLKGRLNATSISITPNSFTPVYIVRISEVKKLTNSEEDIFSE